MKYKTLFFLVVMLVDIKSTQSSSIPKFGFIQQLFTASVINSTVLYWCHRYDSCQKYMEFCQKNGDNTLLFEEQRNKIRDIFKFHGVDSVYIEDRSPAAKKELGVLAFFKGKSVLRLPCYYIAPLRDKKIVISKTNDGNEVFRLTPESIEALIHHEAVHAKYQDSVESMLFRILPVSFSLIAGQLAYVRCKPDRVNGVISALWMAIFSYSACYFLALYRSRYVEKRSDLEIPTSVLANAAADYHESKTTHSSFVEKTFFDRLFSSHPCDRERVRYLREQAKKLERLEVKL